MRKLWVFCFIKGGKSNLRKRKTPACFTKRGDLSSESVAMVTESVRLTWLLAGFLQ